MKTNIIILLSLFMFSCTDPLCYDHPHYAKVNFIFDDKAVDTLDSYKIILYPIDDGIMDLELLDAQEHILANSKTASLSIRPGMYDIVMFNTDSGQTEFFNSDTYQSIYTVGTSLEYRAKEGVVMENTTIAEPGQIYAAHLNNYEITSSTVALEAVEITQKLRLKVDVKNLCYVQSYVGEIGSLYSQYNFSKEEFSGEGNVIKLNSYNCTEVFYEDGIDGYLDINICVFDFVNYADNTDIPNSYLDIVFRLVDNSLITFEPYYFSEFITNLRASQTNETLIIGGENDNTGNSYSTLEIPPVIGMGGGSGDGLGADVDSWGDSTDVDIPFN